MMLLTMRPDEAFNDPENNKRNVRIARKLKMGNVTTDTGLLL